MQKQGHPSPNQWCLNWLNGRSCPHINCWYVHGYLDPRSPKKEEKRTREQLIEIALMAEQAGRYDDMAAAMKAVTETGVELSNEERDLLRVAYKKWVEDKRSSWRVISSIEQKTEGNESKQQMAREYLDKVEKELHGICQQFIILLDTFVIANCSNVNVRLGFIKLKSDFFEILENMSQPRRPMFCFRAPSCSRDFYNPSPASSTSSLELDENLIKNDRLSPARQHFDEDSFLSQSDVDDEDWSYVDDEHDKRMFAMINKMKPEDVFNLSASASSETSTLYNIDMIDPDDDHYTPEQSEAPTASNQEQIFEELDSPLIQEDPVASSAEYDLEKRVEKTELLNVHSPTNSNSSTNSQAKCPTPGCTGHGHVTGLYSHHRV